MVISHYIDVIYIGGIQFEQLVIDSDLFGTVVGDRWAQIQDVDQKNTGAL